jgi:hypothetical protein
MYEELATLPVAVSRKGKPAFIVTTSDNVTTSNTKDNVTTSSNVTTPVTMPVKEHVIMKTKQDAVRVARTLHNVTGELCVHNLMYHPGCNV